MSSGGGPPWVLHLDLDQFLAAVEVLRRPELAGRPVVVGGRGDPRERGVVSTASYEAREHGVHSGQPLRVAARRCPDAVFLPVDKPAYDAASAQVRAAVTAQRWGGVPVAVQVLGWDEMFVGPAAGHGPLEAPEEVADRLRGAVLAHTGLHCSVGIGDNTLQAKIATDLGKPRGRFRIGDDTWFAVMGEQPPRALWGVGAKTAARLEVLGIRTVRDLGGADPRLLAEALGPTTGPWLRRLGRGVGATEVDPTPWVPRAHGREETFQADLTERDDVEEAVRRLTVRALDDVRTEGRPVVRVVLKVRLAPFTTLTRSRTLPAPDTDPAALADVAVALLDRLDADDAARPVRLLGVRLEMADPDDVDDADGLDGPDDP